MPMYIYWFVLTAVISAVLTPLVGKFALARNIVDQPGERKIHTQPIARLGGVAIFLSFWLTIISVLLFNPNALNFVDSKIAGIDQNFLGVALGALVLVVAGVADDIRSLHPAVKLGAQIIASLLVVAFGVRIWWVNNPFGGLNIILGNWTYLVVPLWLVLMINVTNWLDGVDGLAGGIGFIAAIVLMLLSLAPYVNQPETALLAVVLAGAILGFLPFNFHPARIFMGDSGSMFLGYMIGIFAIISGGKFATAALVMGLPIIDALWVIARRIISGKSPWQADRLHLHHRLLDAGFSQKGTVLLLYFISTIFGIIALSTSNTEFKTQALFWLLTVAVLLAFSTFYLKIRKAKL